MIEPFRKHSYASLNMRDLASKSQVTVSPQWTPFTQPFRQPWFSIWDCLSCRGKRSVARSGGSRLRYRSLFSAILSALSDVRHKVLLLEIGADSYVTKPFSPRELLARVRALIRNTTESKHGAAATFDGVRVDFEKMETSLDGHPVNLTPLEFKILRFFLYNEDRIISRAQLLKEAFVYDRDPPLSYNVDVHIYRLRHKLEREPANPTHFYTIHGKGYKFVP